MNQAATELAERGPGLPCVHCGLCLDHCPTYRLFGTEADSPRGRIYLMEAASQTGGRLEGMAAVHIDRCLGCLACETACPSGVSYAERIEEFRPSTTLGTFRSLNRKLAVRIPSWSWFARLSLVLAAVVDGLGLERLRRRLPGLGLVPHGQAKERIAMSKLAITERSPAVPGPRAPVALLAGCGDGLRPEVNRDAVEVLRANGHEPLLIEGCCGALALHAGAQDRALMLARRTVRRLSELCLPRVVTTAAGCGAMLSQYGRLLAEDPLATAAGQVSNGARDISAFLCQTGLKKPRPLDGGAVAYHDACHLRHGQGLTEEPRLVVEAATGRRPADLGDNQICCGSAGTYNLEHPAIAAEIGRAKADLASSAELTTVAVGNIGCQLQLERAFRSAGLNVDLRHPIELLAEAYRRESEGPA